MASSRGDTICHTTATPTRFAGFHILRPAVVPAAWYVLRHPGMWASTLRLLARMVRPQWWRRAPFLPLPDAAYVRFRLETAYGDDGVPSADDLIAYLRWCHERDRDVRNLPH
jgi:hypothetical protein